MSRNQLEKAASPYLLQHKDNPVHWHEWTPAALAEAKAQNKPILLSIGYAACHWCHVMAHESFVDESTARLMNELFVNIKVDREERPDIDQIYMAALHALGQPGGWPLTMFLTSDGEPYWGGTYFPNKPAYGRPSFTQVLREVARIFHEAPDKVTSNTTALKNAITRTSFTNSTDQIDNYQLNEFAKRLYPHMDMTNGGMQGAPKFPNCQILELFLRAAERTGEQSFRSLVHVALKRMLQGGIHDHLGGGFSRYSVDERWHVPHFEKMLYDNAQILELLALGWQQTQDVEFQHAAESIVEWLKRDMLSSSGLFAASQDADSEGVEGKYYCWTKGEIEQFLSPEDGKLFCKYYDVTPEGNWKEIHTGTQTNVLNRLQNIESDPQTEAKLKTSRNILLVERYKRIPPLCDDKILADWNGSMIVALARAAIVFGKDDWLEMAKTAFHSVLESMAKIDRGHIRLGHSLRSGQLVWPGMSSDYTNILRAGLVLNECGGTYKSVSTLPNIRSNLQLAIELAKALVEFHANPESGILSLPAKDAKDVVYRTFSTTDDATPNPNSIFLQNLQLLASATGDLWFSDQANKMLASITPHALRNPYGHASFLNTMDIKLNATEIIIAGTSSKSLMNIACSQMFLTRFILEIDEHSVSLTNRIAAENIKQPAAAYICRDHRCSLPVTSAEELLTMMNEMKNAR